MTTQPEALRLADRLDFWADKDDVREASSELRRQHDEIEQLKAERDAVLAAAEKGTEYVLAHINQDLRAERDALLADAERYRRLRMATREQLNDLRHAIFWGAEYLDAAIDAASGRK